MKQLKEQLKEHLKEILVFSAMFAVFGLGVLLTNYLLNVQQDAITERDLAAARYKSISNGETSEEVLQKEYEEIVKEKEKIASKLQKDYRIQDANLDFINIIKNTKMLDSGDCSISEVDSGSQSGYKKIEVNVRRFYGSYSQIIDFMNFINEYHTKIIINRMDFERERETNNMIGRNLVFTLYGIPQEEV